MTLDIRLEKAEKMISLTDESCVNKVLVYEVMHNIEILIWTPRIDSQRKSK